MLLGEKYANKENMTMIMQPAKKEITDRIGRLYDSLKNCGGWDFAFVTDKINQYYFTGTIQDGVFVLKSDGEYCYFVRRSYERAKIECIIKESLRPMTSYRDVADMTGKNSGAIYIEAECSTFAALERMGKYFDISPKNILPIDKTIQKIRAQKSEYELSWIKESGKQHKILFEDIVPGLLREGINEAELTGELYNEMIKFGYHGVTRFGKFQTEAVVGQLGFGENSIYPTNFDGPGGMKGLYPAVPIIGERERTLKKGDLVFIDIGYGVNGYHTDRTQVYMFGQNPPDEAADMHKKCREIQKEAAALLKPGNIPSEIYNLSVSKLDEKFLSGFMGTGSERVKFLGHGVGLQIDEYPVIAGKFDEPLLENMTIALEPKRSIENFGIVGVEDTYIVTKEGGRCITGGEREIIVV
jgi:Xaa-Pro aminopeptidase